jgi:hypothetical protein
VDIPALQVKLGELQGRYATAPVSQLEMLSDTLLATFREVSLDLGRTLATRGLEQVGAGWGGGGEDGWVGGRCTTGGGMWREQGRVIQQGWLNMPGCMHTHPALVHGQGWAGGQLGRQWGLRAHTQLTPVGVACSPSVGLGSLGTSLQGGS